MTIRQMLIGGSWIDSEQRFEIRNPYDGTLLAEAAKASADDNYRAIGVAVSAGRDMRKLARGEIARGLRVIPEGITKRREEFIKTICAEAAKPLGLAKAEVDRGIATFAWAAGEAERFVGEIVPVDTQPHGYGKQAHTLRVPRGVIYGITPFNFPLNLVAQKVAPALASGNSIIIKPSDRTPLTSLLLGEVFLESGLPAGALQIVPTDVANIDGILADDRVAMISFTGSAEVGWQLKRRAAKKFVTLELGGNASVIVDESADLEQSVNRSVAGAFGYAGQVCISVQRIFAHEKIYDKWLDMFCESASELEIGRPDDPHTQLSVMIDEAAAIRAKTWIDEAVDHGAEIVTGGERFNSLLSATVLRSTTPEMKVFAEEAFAPLVVIERVGDIDDGIAMANTGKYGLQAGVFTNDLQSVRKAASDLEYGGVIINDVPTFRVDNMPYGGVKDSGFGREGVRYAMEEMTEPRLIVMS